MSEGSKGPDLAAWFIGISVAVTLGFGWYAMGQPGVSLEDGDYSCSAGPLALGGGPGATVEDGEVVDVWDFSMRTGEKSSLRWRDAQRVTPKEFTVVSQVPMMPRTTRLHTCERD